MNMCRGGDRFQIPVAQPIEMKAPPMLLLLGCPY